MKMRIEQNIRRIIFIVGLALCSYPLISNIIHQHKQDSLLKTYDSAVLAEDEVTEMFEKAAEYNAVLYDTDPITTGRYHEALTADNYASLLNPYDNGIMGSIEIPVIDVHLSIYHGTDEDILSGAVGHLPESSLPVGGVNTRCILTGHRGSPNARLFTRLDELVLGDLCYIHVLDQTLAYEVTEISVIEPEDIESLTIREGEDLLTLVTCTPYGINSHRLVITAKRTLYSQEAYDAITKKLPSIRECFFTLLPVVVLCIGIMSFSKKRKEEKCDEALSDHRSLSCSDDADCCQSASGNGIDR